MDEKVEVVLKGERFKRVLAAQFNEIKTKYGLKSVDIEILAYLAKYPEENTPSDIYRRIKINKGHISQGIDALIAGDYINPVPDEEDRRVIHYIVKKKAGKIVVEINKATHELENKLFKGISEEEKIFFKSISIKVLENIEELINQ